jgi:hypothetical protein
MYLYNVCQVPASCFCSFPSNLRTAYGNIFKLKIAVHVAFFADDLTFEYNRQKRLVSTWKTKRRWQRDGTVAKLSAMIFVYCSLFLITFMPLHNRLQELSNAEYDINMYSLIIIQQYSVIV